MDGKGDSRYSDRGVHLHSKTEPSTSSSNRKVAEQAYACGVGDGEGGGDTAQVHAHEGGGATRASDIFSMSKLKDDLESLKNYGDLKNHRGSGDREAWRVPRVHLPSATTKAKFRFGPYSSSSSIARNQSRQLNRIRRELQACSLSSVIPDELSEVIECVSVLDEKPTRFLHLEPEKYKKAKKKNLDPFCSSPPKTQAEIDDMTSQSSYHFYEMRRSVIHHLYEQGLIKEKPCHYTSSPDSSDTESDVDSEGFHEGVERPLDTLEAQLNPPSNTPAKAPAWRTAVARGASIDGTNLRGHYRFWSHPLLKPALASDRSSSPKIINNLREQTVTIKLSEMEKLIKGQGDKVGKDEDIGEKQANIPEVKLVSDIKEELPEVPADVAPNPDSVNPIAGNKEEPPAPRPRRHPRATEQLNRIRELLSTRILGMRKCVGQLPGSMRRLRARLVKSRNLRKNQTSPATTAEAVPDAGAGDNVNVPTTSTQTGVAAGAGAGEVSDPETKILFKSSSFNEHESQSPSPESQ